ncbi:MAG: hypothetical protein SPI20_02980 [Ruminococcus callidus]|nr:hypothetical protein [Ruminococcus sp.]MDY6144651.1 hypothetical protein [Ruminococcus callidus]
MVRQIALWDTTRIRFGKFASLFAFVLFASGCVVRIGYESFLDCSLQEFFYVSRMANSIFRFLLDSCYCKLSTLCRGQLAPNVINLKRLLNGKQNVWKYQNGEEKSDSDGREKDV